MGFDMPNLSFLAQFPLALWGLLALLIPLAIHLLSKSRAQIVPFAHLALITVKTSPRLRQLRITQWLLLFLRALMLLIATLIMAELYWHAPKEANTPHILLTEDWLNHASDSDKSQILQQSHMANFTLVGKPNRSLTTQQIDQWPSPNSKSNAVAKALNLWEKVAEYSSGLDPQTSVIVYSTNRLSQFLGHKQALTDQIQWQIKPVASKDTSAAIKAKVWVLFDDLSVQTLPYLKAAFDALNTSTQIDLSIQYSDMSKREENQSAELTADVVINLSHEDVLDGITLQQEHLFTLEQLSAIQDPEFPLLLFEQLFAKEQHDWQFQNAQLSEQQITVPRPSENQLNKTSTLATPHAQPFHLWLILLLVFVFAADRLLSEWRTPSKQVVADN